MSMISEQIERLKCQSDYIRQVIPECKGIADCIDEAIDTIETLSAKVRADNLHGWWIPCSERLPDSSKHLIVANGSAISHYGYYLQPKNKWYENWKCDVEIEKPTYWMDMPDVPKDSIVGDCCR